MRRVRQISFADAGAALLVALAAAGGLVWLALQQGSYDVVPRHTAGLVLWWLVGLGAVVLARPRAPRGAGIVVTVIAAALTLWIAVGLGGTISDERTANELGRWVVHLAPLVLIGWVLPARLWPWVLGGLLAGAVVVVGIALAERLSPGLIADGPTVVFENTLKRASEPLGYWNAVGSWSVMTAALLLALSAHARGWWWRALVLAAVPACVATAYVTYSRSAIGAALLALVVVFVLSRNRWTLVLHALGAVVGGWIAVYAVRQSPQIADATGDAGAGDVVAALVAAGVLLAAVAGLTHWLGADRLRLAPRAGRIAGGAAIVAALIAGAIVVGSYGERAWNDFKDPVEVSTDDPTARLGSVKGPRYRQWTQAIETWKSDRWRGSGAGTFELSWNPHSKSSEFIRDAHNSFIETLSEQGIPGLALLIGFWVSVSAAVVVAVRRASSVAQRGMIAGAGGALAAFLLGTGIDWFWELTALAMFAMALVGVMIAAGARAVGCAPEASASRDADATVARRPRKKAAPGKRSGARVGVPEWAGRGALVVLAIAGVLVLLPGLVGTSEVRRSERAVAAGDLAGARDHARQAADVLPWAATPFLQRALVEERAGDWRAARRALRLAIEREPLDWRYPLVLARVEARAGRPEQALEAYRQAKRLRPKGKFFQ